MVSRSYLAQTAVAAGCSETVVCYDDSSFLMGLELGAAWTGGSALVGCGVGTWTPGGSGNYTNTAYPSWSSTAWTGTMNVGGSVLTATNVPGPGGPSTFTFTRNATSISSSDPLIGTWVVTSVQVDGVGKTPLQAGFAEAAVFQNDGSFMAGMQLGGSGTPWGGSVSTAVAVGTWAPGAPGSYSTTAFPSFGGSASSGTMTLSGSTLTAAGVVNNGHTFDFIFTKQ